MRLVSALQALSSRRVTQLAQKAMTKAKPSSGGKEGSKNKYYAVTNFKGNQHKSFATLDEALSYLALANVFISSPPTHATASALKRTSIPAPARARVTPAAVSAAVAIAASADAAANADRIAAEGGGAFKVDLGLSCGPFSFSQFSHFFSPFSLFLFPFFYLSFFPSIPPPTPPVLPSPFPLYPPSYYRFATSWCEFGRVWGEARATWLELIPTTPRDSSSSILLHPTPHQLVCMREGVGRGTCNMAEYRAFIGGVELALALGITRLHVQGDSMLVVMQVGRLMGFIGGVELALALGITRLHVQGDSMLVVMQVGGWMVQVGWFLSDGGADGIVASWHHSVARAGRLDVGGHAGDNGGTGGANGGVVGPRKQLALALGITRLHVQGDSMLMVMQVGDIGGILCG
ncbi:unnamed protein product [Closterium sp. NIES-54]